MITQQTRGRRVRHFKKLKWITLFLVFLAFFGVFVIAGCAKKEKANVNQSNKKNTSEKKKDVKETATVPDLIDADREEARELVEAEGLVFNVIAEESGGQVNQELVESEKQRIGADVSSTQEVNYVKSQNPPAGTQVKIGTSVDVVIRNEEQVILMSPDPNNPVVVIGPDE